MSPSLFYAPRTFHIVLHRQEAYTQCGITPLLSEDISSPEAICGPHCMNIIECVVFCFFLCPLSSDTLYVRAFPPRTRSIDARAPSRERWSFIILKSFHLSIHIHVLGVVIPAFIVRHKTFYSVGISWRTFFPAFCNFRKVCFLSLGSPVVARRGVLIGVDTQQKKRYSLHSVWRWLDKNPGP